MRAYNGFCRFVHTGGAVTGAPKSISEGVIKMFDSSVFTINDGNLDMRISQAAHYLEEYEKEVARAQGAAGYIFRNKEDALGRIKMLVEYAPNNERIQALYARARPA